MSVLKAGIMVEDSEIDEQIAIRRSLINSMVGDLYPAILQKEIGDLLERKSHIQLKRLHDS